MSAAADSSSGESAIDEKRSLWGRLFDAVFGYDYFISYAWSDGKVYAERLAAKLRETGFQCFLDRHEFRTGDDWRKVGFWALRRTSALILVCSGAALTSNGVLYELETFRRFRKRVVAVDFGNQLDQPDVDPRFRKHLPKDVIHVDEPRDALVNGPSGTTVVQLHADFKGIRQTQWRMGLLAAVVVTLAILATLMVWKWREERRLNMIAIANRLAVLATDAAVELEHERGALLARQAYLINKRYCGDSIARVDHALRAVLGSATFNYRYVPNWKGASEPNIRNVAYSTSTGVAAIALADAVGTVRLDDATLRFIPITTRPLESPSITLASDGKTLAVAGSESGALLYDLTRNPPAERVIPIAGERPTSVSLNRDGGVLFVGTESGTLYSIHLLESAQVQHVRGSDGLGKHINAITVSPDSLRVAAAGSDRGIVLWELDSGRHHLLMKRARSRSSHSVDFSPDGRWLAAASTEPPAVWIWSMKNPDEPPITHRISSPLSVAFTSDGQSLIVGSGIGEIYRWSTEVLAGSPTVVSAHEDEIRALAAVVNDTRFVSGSRDGSIRVWTPSTNVDTAFRWSPNSRIKAPSTAGGIPDGKDWLAYNAASQSAVGAASDGTASLYENLDGKSTITPLGLVGSSAAFSPSGRFLAVTFETQSEDHDAAENVRIWDLGQRPSSLTIAWSNREPAASSGALKAESAGPARVSLVQSKEPPGEPAALEVPGSRDAPGVAFMPGGQYLLTMSIPSKRFNVERTLHLQLASTAALAEEVCSRVGQNLTQNDWKKYVGAGLPYEPTCPNLPAL